MKKTLVPLALALGFAGAAQAQLSLYGLIDASYGKSIYADMLGQKADFHSGGDNGSSEGNSVTRFGLKGSTDVGSGIKMNFKLESNGIQSDGSIDAPFFQRQAWLGASGSFGEVRLGRQDSVPFQTMVDFDFNGASNGVSALAYSGVGPWLRGRQSRSLQYISPTVGGLSGQAGFVPKGNRGPGAKDVISLGAKYAGGPLAAAVSYQSKDASGAKDFTSIAGSYDLGMAKFMVGYSDGGKIASGGSGKGPSLGVNVPVAGFNIGAHYAENSDSDAKIKAYEFWINKEVLKSTYAYFEAGSSKTSLPPVEGEKTKFNGYAVGVIYVF
jgi:predicted porin